MKAFPHDTAELLDSERGMNLRDYFAAKAIDSLIQIIYKELQSDGEDPSMIWDEHRPNSNCFCVADSAYAIADAMMEIREITK